MPGPARRKLEKKQTASRGGGVGGSQRAHDLDHWEDMLIDGEDAQAVNDVVVLSSDSEDSSDVDGILLGGGERTTTCASSSIECRRKKKEGNRPRLPLLPSGASEGGAEEANSTFGQDCGICGTEYNCEASEVVALPCGHILHLLCWANCNEMVGVSDRDRHSCPFCKKYAKDRHSFCQLGGPEAWPAAQEALTEMRRRIKNDSKKSKLTLSDAVLRKQRLYRAGRVLEHGEMNRSMTQVARTLSVHAKYHDEVKREIEALADQLNILSSLEVLASYPTTVVVPVVLVEENNDDDALAASPSPAAVAPPPPLPAMVGTPGDRAEELLLTSRTALAVPRQNEERAEPYLLPSGSFLFHQREHTEGAAERNVQHIMRNTAVFVVNEVSALLEEEKTLTEMNWKMEKLGEFFTEKCGKMEEVVRRFHIAKDHVLAEGEAPGPLRRHDITSSRKKRDRDSDAEAN